MMISKYDIDSEIEDLQWVINLMKENLILSLIGNLPQQALDELNNLMSFENQLHKLERKKHDRNN